MALADFIPVFLGNIFLVNETSWEHMKMMWYPFLAVGIIFSLKTGNRGYFASFVACAVMAMLMNIGAFCVYQSFLGRTILIVDIMIYISTMLCGVVLDKVNVELFRCYPGIHILFPDSKSAR